MRFLYKRPKMEAVQEELNTVLEVLGSEVFVFLDFILFSIILTLLLVPVLKSLAVSIIFFIICYSFLSSLYIFVVSRLGKKR
ncbi:hypothetical protein [Bacillus sp. JJ1764]|uniref:hypothetical protein n=1 Tax=Bacillus sp. JJ1764 TaxID=3122964 RepID=UPI003000145F